MKSNAENRRCEPHIDHVPRPIGPFITILASPKRSYTIRCDEGVIMRSGFSERGIFVLKVSMRSVVGIFERLYMFAESAPTEDFEPLGRESGENPNPEARNKGDSPPGHPFPPQPCFFDALRAALFGGLKCVTYKSCQIGVCPECKTRKSNVSIFLIVLHDLRFSDSIILGSLKNAIYFCNGRIGLYFRKMKSYDPYTE